MKQLLYLENVEYLLLQQNFSVLTYSAFSFYKLISLHKNDNISSVPNLYMPGKGIRACVKYATSTKYSKLEGRNATIAIQTLFYTKKKPLSSIIYTFYE